MIGVYGAGGCGREIMPLLAGQSAMLVDDAMTGQTIGPYRIVSFAEFDALKCEEPKSVVIAVGDPLARRKLAKQCADAGLASSLVAPPQFIRGERCTVGEGAVFYPLSQITSDLIIGRHFHCNRYSYVSHDCEIGDFVTFAPAVRCNGNVVIADDVFVGTGAILRQGTPEKKLRIGKGAVIGAGAVVVRDVPAGATVVGNPARVLER